MLKIDREKLLPLLADFYRLTGIKIAICDEAGTERYNAPNRLCDFCEYVRSSPRGQAACERSDRHAVEVCRKTGKLYLYTCHMGLAECYSPILEQGKCIGFIAFGQSRIREADRGEIARRAEEYGLTAAHALALYERIGYTKVENVRSAAAIMDACASYIYLHGLIEAEENRAGEIAAYISEHLSGDLTVDALCKVFHLSRVEFYNIFRTAFSNTPAEFVRTARLERACELLRNTDLSVTRISRDVGIGDYNYFSKLFRARYRTSPRAYRKQHARV